MKALVRLAWIVISLLAFAPSIAQARPAAGRAWQTAAKLHRGVNILGYDPLWRDPAKARFKPRHFATIRKGGFDFVRIVLQAFDHMDTRDRLDPRWLATLDRMIARATRAGLSVIVDEHDFNHCADDLPTCQRKLTAFWQQVGTRYRGAPDTVLFELLNEPHGALDAQHWNALAARLIAVVRETNPRRTLVVGPSRWNSLELLPELSLPPDDRNILVTVHYYEPFRFTHQGAPWVAEVTGLRNIPFTDADAARIAADFDRVAAWSKANDRPVLLGEFGAYDKSGTPMADRARYTATVRGVAEARGLPWAYWQFDGDFVVYDIDRDAWVAPILHALIP